jgi:prepilin-type processing-associated H-X9-DG protein
VVGGVRDRRSAALRTIAATATTGAMGLSRTLGRATASSTKAAAIAAVSGLSLSAGMLDGDLKRNLLMADGHIHGQKAGFS